MVEFAKILKGELTMFGIYFNAYRNQSVTPMLWYRNGLTLSYSFLG